MSTPQPVTYSLDFAVRRRSRAAEQTIGVHDIADSGSISRIARLMAPALRLERLVREREIVDYASLAHLGWVTRARMSQIMKLLNLAPDIQEQILFSRSDQGLNERNLRPVAACIDWDEQRRSFHSLLGRIRGQKGKMGLASMENLDHALPPK